MFMSNKKTSASLLTLSVQQFGPIKKSIIKKAKNQLLFCVMEICHNLLSGTIPVDKESEK